MFRNNLELDRADKNEEKIDKQLKKLPDTLLQFSLFNFLNSSDTKNLAKASTLFKNACQKQFANILLQHVAYGEQEQAEALLQMDPNLLLIKSNVTDYSFRHFKNITPFQYALWALDRHMWDMLLKYLPQDKAAEQLQELEDKSTDYGKHYDFAPLINALEVYNRIYSYDTKFEEIVDCWCKVVGGAQRSVPAHIANEYCYPNRRICTLPTFTEAYLPRHLHIYALSGKRTNWFSLSANKGIGFDSAVSTLGSAVTNNSAWNEYGENRSLTAMKTLHKVRWEELNSVRKKLGLSQEKIQNIKMR